MQSETLPTAWNNCQCICHRQRGVMHTMACCMDGATCPTPPADVAGLIERLFYTHEHGIFDAQIAGMLASPNEAAHHIAAQDAEIARLREALGETREEVLWCAYHTGHVKDGRWTHMFMSDGEGLAADCGLDPRQADYDDAAIRAAIPVAARAALNPETGHD